MCVYLPQNHRQGALVRNQTLQFRHQINTGPNTKTLKLAKVGLAKVGQAQNWPKSVKELAKVGLAKVGHDQNLAFEKLA